MAEQTTEKKKSSKIIGIDLGTTNSAVSILENGKPTVLRGQDTGKTVPSIVALTKSGEWIVGSPAKRQTAKNVRNTFSKIKRLIGNKFKHDDVQRLKTSVSFDIIESDNKDAWVRTAEGKEMAPPEISAKVLLELKKQAEAYLGEEVTEAVITVPAYFNDAQRQATKDAGRIAGLNVRRIINEPTAAALAYGIDKKEAGKIAVYDLGGGTFDVSILEIANVDGKQSIEVLSTHGDVFLGGSDFDCAIMDYVMAEIKTSEGVDFSKKETDPAKETARLNAVYRIQEAAEKAKIDLSTTLATEINLPFLGQTADGVNINFEMGLSRAKLESLVKHLVDKTIDPMKQALADANLKAGDIDEVIMVGGMIRMPLVLETVKNFFGKEPRRDVNPDEVVAQGAAYQGGILTREVTSAILFDVIPLSIGIKMADGMMDTLIKRNTSIPTEAKEVYATFKDEQEDVSIQVYQGERPKATDNKLLGAFTFDGLAPLPKGKVKVEVILAIDANGILNVTAVDAATKRKQNMIIEPNSGLTEAEVARMVADAEKNAEADKKFKEAIEIKNSAEVALSKVEKDMAAEWVVNGPEELKTSFNTAATELAAAFKDGNVDVMKASLEKLTQSRSALAQKFQDSAAAAAPAAEETAAPAVVEPQTPPPAGPTP